MTRRLDAPADLGGRRRSSAPHAPLPALRKVHEAPVLSIEHRARRRDVVMRQAGFRYVFLGIEYVVSAALIPYDANLIGDPCRVTELASRRDLRAAGDRVPGRIRPLPVCDTSLGSSSKEGGGASRFTEN